MTPRDVARLRLTRQHLTGTPLATAEDVVRHFAAVQAQDYAGAKWSVAQRARGVTDAALDAALAGGALLRTHVVRPTWHLVLPADLRWLLTLTGPRVEAANAYMYRSLEVDGAVRARSQALLARALAGGGRLTRAEAADLFAAHAIAAGGMRLSYLLMAAELDAVVCSGGLRGRQHTYALFDERVPPAAPVSRDEALAKLTRRYFASRGPATIEDYAGWSGLTVAEARRGLEMVRADLERAVVGDRAYWFGALAAPEPPPAADRGRAYLLPEYDEYVVAYSRTRDVAGADRWNADKASPGTFGGWLLLDGQVAGRWRRIAAARAATVQLQLDQGLGSAGRRGAVDAAVDRYGRFLGSPAGWAEAHTPG